MRHYKLITLYRRFVSETQTILERFNRASALSIKPNEEFFHVHIPAQEMCVVKLYDAWSRFCKELVIVSACCQPESRQDKTVLLAQGIKPYDRVGTIQHLEKAVNRKEKSIGWGTPRHCIDAAIKLKLTNEPSISASIGSTPSPTDNLRQIRDFFAHRNENTSFNVGTVAFSMGFPKHYKALQIVNAPSGTKINVFELWIIELRNMAYAAIN
jgi:hypothetical protein